MADTSEGTVEASHMAEEVPSSLEKRQGSLEASPNMRTVSRTLSVGISKVLKVTFSEPSVLGGSPTKESAMNTVGELGSVEYLPTYS